MGGLTYFDLLAKFGVGGAHPGGIHLTRDILSREKINTHSSILDAGCGTGQTAAFLYQYYQANVIGMDINPTMINKAKKRMQTSDLPITVIEGSITDIPFADNTFDFILSESVMAFVHKPTALRECYRVLKKGGRLIANEMTLNTALGQREQKEITNFYAIDSLLGEGNWRQLFEDTGYVDIEVSNYQQPLYEKTPPPEFHFSKDFEPELFNVLNQHAEIIIKYQETLSYRIITCTK